MRLKCYEHSHLLIQTGGLSIPVIIVHTKEKCNYWLIYQCLHNVKCISMQKLLKYTVWFKRNEHFHLKASTGWNDAWRSLLIILHVISWTMLKLMCMQNLI